MAGWAASRRDHPTAAPAAPPLTRVCHRSHVLADPCPSCSYPAPAVNEASTRDRAAPCIAAACSSPRRQSPCTPAGSPPVSAAASHASPACTIATASAAPDGTPGRPGEHIRHLPHETRELARLYTGWPG